MIRNGWVSWAIKAPGIPDKVYTEKNRGIGLIGHSIVGSYEAAIGRFMSEAKDAAGRYTAYAAASCMFILCKNGDLIQMYDIWSSTWTSGGRVANTSYWAIEAEGGPPGYTNEPFTPEQQATLLRLFREFQDLKGVPVIRGQTFREHGELAAELDYAATACPSTRYDWFTTVPVGENPMTPEEKLRLERLEKLTAGYGIAKDPRAYIASGYDSNLLTFGEEALAYADAKGWSAFLGIALAREAAAAATGGGPHHHNPGPTGPAIPD